MGLGLGKANRRLRYRLLYHQDSFKEDQSGAGLYLHSSPIHCAISMPQG